MKKYLIFAASALALASCSSDDFLGDTQGSTPTSANSAINFSGNAGKITRATSNEGTPEKMLDYQFKVYGVKKMSKNGGDKFEPSFTNYSVWYDEAKNTTSNTKGWEYVGNKGATPLGPGVITLNDNQFIKYWDYAASEYRFVAGSPISAFTFNQNDDVLTTGMNIPSATISGLAGHIEANNTETALETNPVYVATPIIVSKSDYQNPVKFEFNRQQAMVRVGIYETIPGYFISEIKFYEADGKKATSNNVILTSATPDYFVGGKGIKGTVKYDWTKAKPSYTFKYIENENLKKDKNWYAGKYTSNNKLATKSTDPVADLYGTDKDMSTTTGYFTVLPTKEADASPILIKCDYELTSDDGSGETIKVTGATAAIPAAFSKWEANTRYTYLFKISDNTNGTTGTPGTDDTGLYPITFDAVVKEVEQGTTTTVATPSITTYQDGSVTDKGIEYNTGKAIKVTVTNADGTELTLNSTDNTAVGYVAVYKLSKERTEADLQLDKVTKVEFTSDKKQDVTLATDNNSFTFTPNEAGYYAIQYLTKAATTTDPAKPAAYTYKVVHVTPAP